MKSLFKEMDVATLAINPISLIGSDWMLVTAGTPDKFNTMTASWGGLGHLWDKNVCFAFVRPSRYTYEFMEKNSHFTLSFFPPEFKKELSFCGAHSGRTVNKMEKTGLTPVGGDHDTVSFAQARLVLICRKIYYQDLIPGQFLDKSIPDFYTGTDHHRMYIGEIVTALGK